jgi:hypothetical protein
LKWRISTGGLVIEVVCFSPFPPMQLRVDDN